MKSLMPLIILLLLYPLGLKGYDRVMHKNLKDNWKVYENDTYKSFSEKESTVSTIYFEINADQFGSDYLDITSSDEFSLFVNGQLIAVDHVCSLKIDSLSKVLSAFNLSVAIHQKKINSELLTTHITSHVLVARQDDMLQQRSSHFRDFFIIGMLVLASLLVLIIRLNPRLASDYFSIAKIFSMREGDDSQMYSRITSSTNILFYVFCSLLIGYCLMVIFHFVSPEYAIASLFQSTNFSSAIVQWVQLSFITLAVFFIKILLVYCLTRVLRTPGVAGVHFFNWVRLLLLVFGSMTLVLTVYFVLYGQNKFFFSFLLNILPWALAGWMILILIKLSNRLGHSLFHLFSYICATEFIPFLITLKVLFS